MIAALYVDGKGNYAGLAGVDAWDEARDARTYAGPWPVVAHPPCARWGAYWFGSPRHAKRYTLGDDGGCFAAALASVEEFGGVLEHPARSHAWERFGIAAPEAQGWTRTRVGWTCQVAQGNYGHGAKKSTWLYFVGPYAPPDLVWGDAPHLDAAYQGTTRRDRSGPLERMSKRKRASTPIAFRDLLLSLARHASAPALFTRPPGA